MHYTKLSVALLLLLKLDFYKASKENPDDMLGFENPAPSNHGKIYIYKLSDIVVVLR